MASRFGHRAFACGAVGLALGVLGGAWLPAALADGWGRPDAPPKAEAKASLVDFGQLSFEVPASYNIERMQRGIKLTSARRGASVALMFDGPIPVEDGETLPRGFQRMLDRYYPRAEGAPAIEAHPMDLASKLPAAAGSAQYRGGSVVALHVVVRSHGAWHMFSVVTNSQARLRELLNDEAQTVLGSLQAQVMARPSVEVSLPTRSEERFCLGFQVPTAFELPGRFDPLHRERYTYALPVPGTRPYPAKVMVSLSLGAPSDLEAAVRLFARGELFGSFVSGKPQQFRTYLSAAWKTPGGRGSTVGLTHLRDGKFSANLVAHAFTIGDATIYVGSVVDFRGVDTAFHKACATSFTQFTEDLRRMATSLALTRPIPPRQARWEAFLAKKGSYRYHFAKSSGSVQTIWVVSDNDRRWTFFEDGTCKYSADSFFGTLSESSNDPSAPARVTDQVYGSLERAENIERARYVVLGGAQGALVLVTRPGTGIGGFHLLEPDKETTYGPFKPKGLAIDGEVEGSYSRGAGWVVYEPWKN